VLRPPRRLPRKFNRPVTPATKKLLRKHKRVSKKRKWKDLLHRIGRRSQRKVQTWWKSITWILLLLLLLLLLAAFGMLVFSPIVEVREVKVIRYESRLDKEETQKVLTPFFNRHLFFLSLREVEEVLEDAIRDLNDVRLYKEYPSMLRVEIELDPIVARLKILDPGSEDVEVGTGAILDFLTEEGMYAIAPLSEGTESLPLITVVDWGVRPVEGDVLVTPELLSRMEESEKSLSEQFGHTIEGRKVFLRAQEYHLLLGRGIELWFDKSSPVEDQLLRYRTFLKGVNLDEVEEYIDLRISDRVVYK